MKNKDKNHISKHIIQWRIDVLGQKKEDFEFIEENKSIYRKNYQDLKKHNIGTSENLNLKKEVKNIAKGKYYLN